MQSNELSVARGTERAFGCCSMTKLNAKAEVGKHDRREVRGLPGLQMLQYENARTFPRAYKPQCGETDVLYDY